MSVATRTERFVGGRDSILVSATERIGNEILKEAKNTPMADVLSLLDKERNRSKVYRETWLSAESKFKQKQAQNLIKPGVKSVPAECHIAIVAYTLDLVVDGHLPLYLDFNRKSRQLVADEQDWRSKWNSFEYKSLYCLLVRSFGGFKNVPDLNRKIYRGLDFHYSEAELGSRRLVLPQFTSCSIDENQAKIFVGVHGKGTILEFSKVKDTEAGGIAMHSQFPSENEVLVLPFTAFEVKEIDSTGDVHRIVLGGSLGTSYVPTSRTC